MRLVVRALVCLRSRLSRAASVAVFGRSREAGDRRGKPGIDADTDGGGAQAWHQQRAPVWLATEADRRPDDAFAAVTAQLCPGGDRADAVRQARSGACDLGRATRTGRACPASAGPDRDPAARERDTAGRFTGGWPSPTPRAGCAGGSMIALPPGGGVY